MKMRIYDRIRYTTNALAGLLWTVLYSMLNEHVSDATNYWLLNKINARAMWCLKTEPFATALVQAPTSLYNVMFIVEFTEDEMMELLMKNV